MSVVKQLTAAQCAEFLTAHPECLLYDVRTDEEREICKLERARQLTADNLEAALAGDKNLPLIFHCHFGMRSLNAAQLFADEGFAEVYNMTGGIDAWAAALEPEMERY